MKLTSKIRNNLSFLEDIVKGAMPMAAIGLAVLSGYLNYNLHVNRTRPSAETPAPIIDTLNWNNYANPASEYSEGIPMDITDKLDLIFSRDQNLPFMHIMEKIIEKREQMYSPPPQERQIRQKTIQPEIREKSLRNAEKGYAHVSKNINRLMSNDFFRDSDYLNEKDITQILDGYHSVLRGRNVESAIINAAKKYSINPAIILGRLQVEQGLLTKQKASKNALKYATGYGALDNGKNLKSNGLNSQIDNTARVLNKHFSEFQEGTIVKLDYGKTRVQPENKATAAILRYTPHTHGARLNSEVITNYVIAKLER